MSVATTRRRLVDMWSRINGVRTAYDNIPTVLQAAELPGLVIFPGKGTYNTDEQGDQTNVITRIYRMVLYLAEAPLNTEGQTQIEADPFFDAVPAHFSGRPQLTLDGATEPQNSVFNSALLEDDGFQIGAYPLTTDKQYALIEWRLQVVELADIDYVG